MTTIRLRVLIDNAPPTDLRGAFSGDEGITEIVCDSRKATAGSLFVAIRGAAADGHDYLLSAYRAGCRTFAVMQFCDTLPSDALQLRYDNTRQALSSLSAAFYRDPTKHLRVVGVTGTKGKTTTCLLAYALLSAAGVPVGYIGTNGVLYDGHRETTANTTPESLILQRIARDMVDCGVKVLLLEVSSQALIQYRVENVIFDTVVYTNLYRDHIGPNEHPDFDAYKAAKRSLFTNFSVRTMILNADDPHAEEMLNGSAPGEKLLQYSTEGSPVAEICASTITPTLLQSGQPGITFTLNAPKIHHAKAELPLPGKYNVGNALAALAICSSLGISLHDALRHLPSASIPGRCERIAHPIGASIVIDYAHNEKSLLELLLTMREYLPAGGKLLLLFGSVGERTKERRASMGAVASLHADLCILTSDNPGTEEPMDIIHEIHRGFAKDIPCICIPNREEAILKAISLVNEHDILILAGKGHENYQLIGREKIPFSEREIVCRALSTEDIISSQTR